MEEEREQFQVPQREEDGGITLNKCIICAVILLGLGTIFISGKNHLFTHCERRKYLFLHNVIGIINVKRSRDETDSNTEVYDACRCLHGPGSG